MADRQSRKVDHGKPMIEAIGLSKFYGVFAATRDVSFTVNEGELVAFLGPNGAGKSTTMKLLTGYLSPSQGSAKIAGHDMATDRRLAGMLFNLTADADAAGELRSYGLSGHLAGLHARLAASLDRRARTEAGKVLAVQGSGWLLYAAGLMAAIAFVAIRASDGAISLGTVLNYLPVSQG